MKLDNRTHYDTKLLRTIICRAHARLAKAQGRLPQWKRVTITVRRRLKGTHTSGHAYLKGTKAVFTLPCPTTSPREIYRLAWHELQHLHGYNHANMGIYFPLDEETNEETQDLPASIHEVPPAPPSRDQRAAQELALVDKRIKAWLTKQKRAATALKKLHRRKRALARRAGADCGAAAA